jgi:hypothetical protein
MLPHLKTHFEELKNIMFRILFNFVILLFIVAISSYALFF